MSYFIKDSLESDGGNFDTQKMELLDMRSELCTYLSIEFLDRGTSKDKFRSKENMKIKEGIDLVMKREKEGMNFFSCWICNEFGNYASTCPKRIMYPRHFGKNL